MARAIRRALSNAGYRVQVAPSRREALATPGASAIGVFDIQLPDGSGLDVARALLTQGRVGGALFFTACTDREILEQARQLGPVVNKREGIAELLRALRDSVEGDAIRAKYAEASRAVRKSTEEELEELDGLSSEGLSDE